MRVRFLFVAVFLLLAADGASADIRLPEASPGARVQQEVGVAEVEIVYHRPRVKGRAIWGTLVPWNEVWRLGANEATTLRLSHDATIEGHAVPAGTYSLFAIPNREKWTMVINRQPKQWGAFRYDAQQDVVRFDVTPRTGEHVETMDLDIDPLSDSAAVVTMAWEKVRVPFRIEFATEKLVWESIDRELAKEGEISWREYQKAAGYALEKKERIDEALAWAEKAMVDQNFWRYEMKAKLLAANGRTAEAVEWMDRAIEHAKAGIESGVVPKAVAATYLAGLENARKEWQTMRAISIASFGAADVLRVERIARPTPAEGELLVRVHAASVNPVDTHTRAGDTHGITGATVPYVPGFDISGVVEAVGPGVRSFRKGDDVFAMLDLRRGGGYAEYAIVKEPEAARKPKRLSHVEAAAVPLTALTAWQALFDTADLQSGQTVLIHAGAGGVGTMAIQLAKWKGAKVIATASASNHDYLRKLGADVVIDYRTQRFEELARNVDVVLDPIGGETQVRSLSVLRPGGTLVSIVGLGPAARAATTVRAKSILVKANGDQLARIAELADAGRVNPTVSHTFTLDQARDAHVQSETRHTHGKIVLKVRD